jgi:ketoreductase
MVHHVSNRETSSKRLTGKSAIVTGASRGIGAATAIALAKQGADVAILARSQGKLEELKEEINALGVSCFARVCDVADQEMLEKFISAAGENLGPVSILINNAGTYATQPLLHHSMDTWQKVINTNLTSAMWASRCLLPDMIQKGWGRIINISSISGKQGEPYGSAYSAAKFALIGLTQSTALEVARHGITVNAVCPGWVETQMALDQLQDEEWCQLNEISPADSIEIARLSIPQGRFVQPHEVAALVAYLCGDEAGSITGQAINICGGLSLH